MNILLIFMKYNIFLIFVTISLISSIYTFENIPEWKNNFEKISLPPDLMNSEILSISIDNSTLNTLYLIKENNISYLYIKENKYKNKLQDELTYINSPLIEYNGDFYFCSSSKNILKFSLNGELIKIQNPENLNNYENYELKCFFLNKENVIIVTFINTPYVNSYDLTKSIWITNENQDSQLKLGEKIYDSNIYNILDIKTVRFGVLYEEQSLINFSLYQFNNQQFGEIHITNFNANLYSKTICTFGVKEQQVFIFTYEPKVINSYNFYQIDLGQRIIINSEGNSYLKIFKEAEIYDAYFIENSPVLFYNIKKKEITGKYNYYLGVVDIENLVILYNIKIENYKKVFYDFGYLYKNKGFLKYFERGNQFSICPFIYDFINKFCVFYINDNQYYNIFNSSGKYENEIVVECSNKRKNNKYCIEQCPIGYDLQNGECIKCQQNQYYNYGTKKCINENQLNNTFQKEGKIIYNCEDAKLKYYDHDCYESCSDIYGINNPVNENECIPCKNQNQIYYDFKCYDNCSILYGIVNPENENECLICKNHNKIYYNFSCYDNCSEIYGIISPEDKNKCISCEEQHKIYYDSNCYDNCSILYGIVNDKNQKECIICRTQHKYYLDNQCVDNCPEGHEIRNKEIFYYKVTYCQNCLSINKYYYDQKCYDICPYERQLKDSNKICYFCNEKFPDKKYYQKGICVTECDIGYESINNDIEFYCNYCKDENKYFNHNKKCEEKCEKNSLNYTDTNICYFCNETELKYKQDQKCVKSCDVGYETIEGEDICNNCKEYNNMFYQDGKCVKECNESLAWNESDHICVDCKKEKDLLFKIGFHKCVQNCHHSIRNNDVCMSCPSDKKYFFDYDCYEMCPKYTFNLTDDEDYYCESCGSNQYYQDGNCEANCQTGFTSEEEFIGYGNKTKVKVCKKCGTDNRSWYVKGECKTQCEPSQYGANDHFCRSCFCGFSKSHDCVNTTDKCLCEKLGNEEIFGDNCEFKSKEISIKKDLSIIPFNRLISKKKSIFKYKLKDEIMNKYISNEYTFSIKWSLYLDGENEVNNKKYFATGTNEDSFIINSDFLVPKQYKIGLVVTIKDKKNNLVEEFNDELEIMIQELNFESTIKFDETESSETINRVMNNTFRIETSGINNRFSYELFYKVLIEDEYNEIIPIKQKNYLQPILKGQQDSLSLNVILPIHKNFIFEISNIREEKFMLYIESFPTENSNIKYSLEEILNNNLMPDYCEIEKIFLIMKYLDLNRNLKISDNNYELLIKFITEKLDNVVNDGYYEDYEIKESKRYYINYYEPKTIFSLMNKIFLNQGEKIPDKYIESFIKIFDSFLNLLTENKNPHKYIERYPNSDILSLFRTFDHIFEIFINKEKNGTQTSINIGFIFQILEKLSEYLIKGTYPGETIRLVGRRLILILTHFGKYQNNLALSSIDNISQNISYNDFRSFSFEDYNLNQEKCDDDSLFCIEPNDYKDFKDNMLDKINVDLFSLSLLGINNNIKNIQNENEGNFFKIRIMNTNDIRTTKNKGIFYDIEFSFKNNDEKRNYSNITCVPKTYINDKEYYCFTYFNYEKNRIKCTCNVFDEITYISDFNISNFYKDIQSKKKIKHYNLVNKVSISIIFIILMIILLSNCIYLLYDIKTDVNLVDDSILSFSEKVKQKYLKIKILNNSSIFSFAFYVFYFKFSFLSPLRQCDSKKPKYIKNFIILVGILYGFIISLLAFLIKIPSKDRENIINKRDILNPFFELKNGDFFLKYFNDVFIFAIIGFCLTGIFIYIFGIILSYNKDELIYWRELKIIFSNYISSEIKGNVLLGKNWNKIKTRIIAYTNFCGKYILNKISRKINLDNYLNFIKNKKNNNSNNKKDQLLPSFNLDEDESIKIDYDINESNDTGSYRAPSIDSVKLNQNNSNEKNLNVNLEIKNNSLYQPKKNSSTKNINYLISQTDDFQLYSKNIKINKNQLKFKKYEKIKNKYINKIKNKNLYETEIDSVSENRSFSHEIYEQLTIQYENNFSYFPFEQYITRDTLTSISENNWNNPKNRPDGYCLLFYINIALIVLLLIPIFILLILNKIILNNFGIFAIKVWISSTIYVYIIIFPLLYYIRNIIGSILLFKLYHLRNRKIYYKILFWIFVDKTMIYIFKVRNYITKYKTELDY